MYRKYYRIELIKLKFDLAKIETSLPVFALAPHVMVCKYERGLGGAE